MSLKEYNRKRKFTETPEPKGKSEHRKGELRFVVQLHRASRLHFDVRLEMGGVFKSWAVPRGPSLNPKDRRLAVLVEDHPITYGSFEGIIPRGNYGAGTVMIWDQGTYQERNSDDPLASDEAMQAGLKKGHMTFILEGQKLRGEFALIRLKKGDEKAWLMVKKRDEFSTYKTNSEEIDRSVTTGRTISEIAAQAEKKGEIWLPKRTLSARRNSPLKKIEAKSKTRAAHPAKASNKKDPVPRRVKPMLPRLDRSSHQEADRIYCELHGGLRAIAEVEVEGKRAHLYSKQLMSFDKKFPSLITTLENAGLTAILDGEITPDGKRYRVFDLLYLDGQDLRSRPLSERYAKLKKLKIFGNQIELCEPLKEQKSSKTVLARNVDSLYTSGVSQDWTEIRRTSSDKASKKSAAPSPEERGPVFTHLDKVYWKHDGITKGDLIEYYRQIAPILLPHLADRPMSLHRFPNGSETRGFYQKDFTGYKPRWIETHRIYSESAGKSVDYVLCQNESTLLYLANLGCIEMNPWLSRVQTIDNPDYLVIDIDPDRQSFAQVVEVTLAVRKVLEKIGAESLCKTSGATGMHICVPLQAQYDFETARTFAEAVCQAVNAKLPALTTLERSPGKRGGRIYLDFMQNRIGQTLASPYSVRPRPGAPVSTPLRWSEVTSKLSPDAFTLANTIKRLDRVGDLWKPLLKKQVDIEACLKKLIK